MYNRALFSIDLYDTCSYDICFVVDYYVNQIHNFNPSQNTIPYPDPNWKPNCNSNPTLKSNPQNLSPTAFVHVANVGSNHDTDKCRITKVIKWQKIFPRLSNLIILDILFDIQSYKRKHTGRQDSRCYFPFHVSKVCWTQAG